MDEEENTYYELLGVSRLASPEQIKAAYRQLARRHHPDVRQAGADGGEAPRDEAEWFKRLTAAYHTLSDTRRKAAYDTWLLRSKSSSRERSTFTLYKRP